MIYRGETIGGRPQSTTVKSWTAKMENFIMLWMRLPSAALEIRLAALKPKQKYPVLRFMVFDERRIAVLEILLDCEPSHHDILHSVCLSLDSIVRRFKAC
jgi:hypothetical protein